MRLRQPFPTIGDQRAMTEPGAEVDPVDHALTVATRSRTRQGRGAESTRREYAREWARWRAWRHPLDPTVVSSELLATYASAECAAGRAVATVRKAVAAIKSELRSRGVAVPDAVPAHVVLREVDDIRKAAGVGSKPAEPLMLDDFVLMLAATDQTTTAGQRDAAILHLLFAGLRVGEIEPLNVGDVEVFDPSADLMPRGLGAALGGEDALLLRLRVRLRGDEVTGRVGQRLEMLHWRSTDGVHDERLCPVEAVARWALRFEAYPGVSPGWPLLRPVDDVGRIGGLDAGWSGTLGPGGGRLAPSGIGLAFTRALAAAHLEGSGRRFVPLSLKLGGAAARLAQGAQGLGAFAVGAWSPTSRAVVELLRRYTPQGAGVVSLRWPRPPGFGGPDGPAGVDGGVSGVA